MQLYRTIKTIAGNCYRNVREKMSEMLTRKTELKMYQDGYRKIVILPNGKLIATQTNDSKAQLNFYYDTGYADLRFAFEYDTVTQMELVFRSLTAEHILEYLNEYLHDFEVVSPNVPQPSTTLN